MTQTFVIVGAGMAGGKAAETLREEGFDGRDRPARRRGRAPLRAPAAEQGLPARRGRARRRSTCRTRAGTRSTTIELRTGTTVEGARRRRPARSCSPAASGRPTTALLLATGAQPRRPPIPGADLDGVHSLRTVADSDALRERARRRRAPRRRRRGLDRLRGRRLGAPARHARWRMVEPQSLPLERVLGRRARRLLSRRARRPRRRAAPRHRRRGHRGRRPRRARAHRRRADLECDAVARRASASLRAPRWPRAPGSTVDNGILVDERAARRAPRASSRRATSPTPTIRCYGRRLRVEHWANALEQGPAAARACSAQDVAYDRVPYFFSDQYDVGMEYAGLADGPTTRSSSAAIPPRASSSPSGCATGAWSRG